MPTDHVSEQTGVRVEDAEDEREVMGRVGRHGIERVQTRRDLRRLDAGRPIVVIARGGHQ